MISGTSQDIPISEDPPSNTANVVVVLRTVAGGSLAAPLTANFMFDLAGAGTMASEL